MTRRPRCVARALVSAALVTATAACEAGSTDAARGSDQVTRHIANATSHPTSSMSTARRSMTDLRRGRRTSTVLQHSWSRAKLLGRGAMASLAVGDHASVVAWEGRHRAIIVARRVHGRWTAKRTLGVGWGGPVVASNRSSMLAVAWFTRDWRLMVARRVPGRRWERPQVAATGFDAHGHALVDQVAVSETGAVAVVWRQIRDETTTDDVCEESTWAYVSYATPSGRWEPAYELLNHVCISPELTAALGDRGNLDVVYAARAGLRLVRRSVTQGWLGPQAITDYPAFRPHLLRTPRGGTVVVAWEAQTKGHHGYEARRRVHGRWGPVHSWVRHKFLESNWDAAIDGRGNATLAWTTFSDSRLHARRWPRSGSLQPPKTLAGNVETTLVKVAAGRGGDTVVLGSRWGPKQDTLFSLLWPRRRSWDAERLVTTVRRRPCCTSTTLSHISGLAVHPSGEVAAVWEVSRSPRVDEVRYGRLNRR